MGPCSNCIIIDDGAADAHGDGNDPMNTFVEYLHFVEILHDRSRELWVTAGSRKEAVANVLKHFSPGHLAQLSDRRVTPEEASRFQLKNGEACVYEGATAGRDRGRSRS